MGNTDLTFGVNMDTLSNSLESGFWEVSILEEVIGNLDTLFESHARLLQAGENFISIKDTLGCILIVGVAVFEDCVSRGPFGSIDFLLRAFLSVKSNSGSSGNNSKNLHCFSDLFDLIIISKIHRLKYGKIK